MNILLVNDDGYKAKGLRVLCEAMARIEAGEDPEKVDEQFSELFDETHDPFVTETQGRAAFNPGEWLRRIQPPRRDPTWYDMPRETP